MSTPLPSFAASAAYADAPGPVLVTPEIRKLDGVVREAYVPPFAPPVRHGSLADLPFDNASAVPDAVVLSRKGPDGRWRDVTAAEFAAQVRAVARGLLAEGLMPGDRLAVLARTTYEWTLLDFAAWAAGLVTVPVYPTSSLFQTRWILQDSGAVALVTETTAQAAALGPELDRLPDLRHLWVMEKGHVDRLAELGDRTPDAEVDVRRGMLGPGTLATLVYTSGTTGRPKGCALTHGNFFAEVDNAIELLYPVFKANTDEDPSILLFLPMSHVFGRMVAVACVRARVRLGHAPSLRPEELLPDLAAFRPTCLLTIPYMLEKVFNSARAKAEAGGRAATFDRAASVAVRYGEDRTSQPARVSSSAIRSGRRRSKSSDTGRPKGFSRVRGTSPTWNASSSWPPGASTRWSSANRSGSFSSGVWMVEYQDTAPASAPSARGSASIDPWWSGALDSPAGPPPASPPTGPARRPAGPARRGGRRSAPVRRRGRPPGRRRDRPPGPSRRRRRGAPRPAARRPGRRGSARRSPRRWRRRRPGWGGGCRRRCRCRVWSASWCAKYRAAPAPAGQAGAPSPSGRRGAPWVLLLDPDRRIRSDRATSPPAGPWALGDVEGHLLVLLRDRKPVALIAE
ncbi:2-succinylbenzoate--CoA ligase [Streptomyces fumanus]